MIVDEEKDEKVPSPGLSYSNLTLQKLEKLVPSCSTSFFQLNAHVCDTFYELLGVQLFKPIMNCVTNSFPSVASNTKSLLITKIAFELVS